MERGHTLRLGPLRQKVLENAGMDSTKPLWEIVEELVNRAGELKQLYFVFKRAQKPILRAEVLQQPDFDLLNKLERRFEPNVVETTSEEAE